MLAWSFRQNMILGCCPVFEAISARDEFIVPSRPNHNRHCVHCIENAMEFDSRIFVVVYVKMKSCSQVWWDWWLLSNAPSGLLQWVTVPSAAPAPALCSPSHTAIKLTKNFRKIDPRDQFATLLHAPSRSCGYRHLGARHLLIDKEESCSDERESGLHLHGKVVHHQPSEPCCAQYGDFEQRFTSIQSVTLVTVTRGSEESSNSSLRDQPFCIMQ